MVGLYFALELAAAAIGTSICLFLSSFGFCAETFFVILIFC